MRLRAAAMRGRLVLGYVSADLDPGHHQSVLRRRRDDHRAPGPPDSNGWMHASGESIRWFNKRGTRLISSPASTSPSSPALSRRELVPQDSSDEPASVLLDRI
jgi:hypothetical protein